MRCAPADAARCAETTGLCGMGAELKVALALRTKERAVYQRTRQVPARCFFSGCTLRCVFCQNLGDQRRRLQPRQHLCGTAEEVFRELEAAGASNINLVSPTVAPWIALALEEVPGISCGVEHRGYERVETLRLLERKVQIYLPDLNTAYPQRSGAVAAPAQRIPGRRRRF